MARLSGLLSYLEISEQRRMVLEMANRVKTLAEHVGPILSARLFRMEETTDIEQILVTASDMIEAVYHRLGSRGDALLSLLQKSKVQYDYTLQDVIDEEAAIVLEEEDEDEGEDDTPPTVEPPNKR